MNFETGFAGDSLEAENARVRNRRRIMVIAGAIVLVLAVALLWSRLSKKEVMEVADTVPRVTVVVPGSATVSAIINTTGSLAARREMPVGVVGEGGEVSSVLVEPGAWVKAGQVLARVERSVQAQERASAAAQLEVARADARLAENDLTRAQALVGRGFISKADLDRKTATRDSAVARVRVAQAQLGQQHARLNRLDIKAPADGLVLTRTVEPGQIIGAGTGVLFRIAKGGLMEMLARVGESDLLSLRVGDRAEVTPVGGSQSYEGHIWQISPVVDPQTRQGSARIALTYNRDLRPGGFASARIVSGTAKLPVLPESAIQNDDKGSYVFIVNAQNVVERRNVKIGQVSAAGVSITQGLTGNEQVATLAGGFLTAGQKVQPERQKAAAK
jgi:RND family efflux transporter MFP subunit